MDLIEVSTKLVAKSIIGGSGLSIAQIPDAIQTVHNTLMRLKAQEEGACFCEEPKEQKKKLLSPEKSVKKNVIICLECGQGFRMIHQKHLLKAHGLTRKEYREKHDLPKKFPLICRVLQQRRRQVAIEKDLASYTRRGAGR